MDIAAECPHCGLATGHSHDHYDIAVNPDSLREDQRRIQELTREVRLLQKTVAQLRAVRR